MSGESKHLNAILTRHNRTANLQVVFVDIVKYSKRRTLTQTEVIDQFTACLTRALKALARDHIDYAQANQLNFSTDVIVIPTGDGAAVLFSFDGLHDAHLDLPKTS